MSGDAVSAEPQAVEIVPVSVETLRADTNGRTVREMAELAYHAFREPPWCDDCERPRLHFGIGVDLMRHHALALIARSSGSNRTVGYVLGYEVVREGEGPRQSTLADIAGTDALYRFLPAAARVFYVDTLCVDPRFRRQHIAERLYRSLNDRLRREGFDFHINRTHVAAYAARRLCAKLDFKELPVPDRTFPDRTYWLLGLS